MPYDERIGLIRVIACFLVVLLHTGGSTFGELNSGWYASNFYDSMSRICVPLFFMISGALLIPQEQAYGSYFLKRIIRILPPLLFWSLIYYHFTGWYPAASCIDFTKKLFIGKVVTLLWYLYVLLGLYSFLPFLKKIFNGCTKKERRVFLLLWFLACSVSFLETCFDLKYNVVNLYGFTNFTGFFGYFFLGAVLYTEVDSQPNASLFWLNLFFYMLCSCLIMFFTAQLSFSDGKPNQLFYGYLTPLVIFGAFFLFLSILNIGKIPSPVKRMIKRIDACSLGIYCLHFLILLQILPHNSNLKEHISLWLLLPLETVLIFLTSWGIVAILRFIPFMRFVL